MENNKIIIQHVPWNQHFSGRWRRWQFKQENLNLVLEGQVFFLLIKAIIKMAANITYSLKRVTSQDWIEGVTIFKSYKFSLSTKITKKSDFLTSRRRLWFWSAKNQETNLVGSLVYLI